MGEGEGNGDVENLSLPGFLREGEGVVWDQHNVFFFLNKLNIFFLPLPAPVCQTVLIRCSSTHGDWLRRVGRK